jgi:beta-lactamase regulating signal transducer with metallopeptidase domain
VHLLIYTWIVVTLVLLARVWLRVVASRQLIEDSLEKGYMLKPTTVRKLDPDLVMPPNVRVIVTPEDAGPATLGVFDPAVVIPESLLPWVIQHRDPTPQECNRFRQVLRHELAHITNRDDLLTLGTMVMLSFFWFHPIAHWAYRRVRMNNELCCDETVLASGIRPTEYVDTLMNIVAGEYRRRDFAMSILGDSTPAGVLRRRLQYLLSDRIRTQCKPALAYVTIALLIITMPRFLSEGKLIEVMLTSGETRRIALESLPYYPDVERVLTPNVEDLYDYAPIHVLLASGIPVETLPAEAVMERAQGAAGLDVPVVLAGGDASEVSPDSPSTTGEALANVTDATDEPESTEAKPSKKRSSRGSRPGVTHLGGRSPILPPPPPSDPM